MSFGEIINTLIIKPLQLFYEIVYMTVYEITDNPAISIIILSIIMNFLLMPLYKRADAIQLEERNMEQKLRNGVTHIKKTFRGDEKMMILQTYYRQNHYKPAYVLRGAVSLALEIPFFLAAYVFLSNLYILKGVSFGPIVDLASPDAMLKVSGISINILPVVMTIINIISSLLYTKGSTFRAKLQLYLMALIFLVVLYQSPSGLVLYWTMNNIFILIKTLIERVKNPDKFFANLCLIVAITIMAYGVLICPLSAIKLKLFYIVMGVLFMLPTVYRIISVKFKTNQEYVFDKKDNKLFFTAAIFLAVLNGILIPSSVIVTSPQEFIGTRYFYHPLWYVCGAFCLAIGAFLIWLSVFYAMANEKIKHLISTIIAIVSVGAMIDYMFFGKNHGLLKPNLQYDEEFDTSWIEQLVNLLVLMIIAVLIIFVIKKWKKVAVQLIFVASIALLLMSSMNLYKISNSIENVKQQMIGDQEKPNFTLSKNEKNVIVIMMDRAYNGYIPYFLNEKPELKEKYDGFTYYSNTISFGGHTNFGAPALYGGYEYTPLEINKREDESLASKHNEALKVLPTIFSDNSYEVTVTDVAYINYQFTHDYSIFNDINNVKAFSTEGAFSTGAFNEQLIVNNQRNFFCYSLLKTIPVIAQETLYQNGTYRQCKISEVDYAGQYCLNNYVAEGLQPSFMDPFLVLENLPVITNAEEDKKGQFIVMTNYTAHNQAMLQEPEYLPMQKVDNTLYEQKHGDRFELDGKKLPMENALHYSMYQSNMAALLQLGEWFDYLREKGVYDNTRIILVADHGFSLGLLNELVFEDLEDCNWYYPLLMVKDFNSKGFHESEEFMTNADTPTLAMKDLIEHPVNPYTGKEISSKPKLNGPLYIIASREWEIDKNNGNKFLPSVWLSVHDNLWDRNNWNKYEEDELVELMR